MLTKIISIGNSKGIRIPKALLEESGLGTNVELRVKKGEIRVIPAKVNEEEVKDTLLLSENLWKLIGIGQKRRTHGRAYSRKYCACILSLSKFQRQENSTGFSISQG